MQSEKLSSVIWIGRCGGIGRQNAAFVSSLAVGSPKYLVNHVINRHLSFISHSHLIRSVFLIDCPAEWSTNFVVHRIAGRLWHILTTRNLSLFIGDARLKLACKAHHPAWQIQPPNHHCGVPYCSVQCCSHGCLRSGAAALAVLT